MYEHSNTPFPAVRHNESFAPDSEFASLSAERKETADQCPSRCESVYRTGRKFNGNCILRVFQWGNRTFAPAVFATADVAFFSLPGLLEMPLGKGFIFHAWQGNFSRVRKIFFTREKFFFHPWKIYGSRVRNFCAPNEKKQPVCFRQTRLYI
jgi:hypothetical protein